MIYRNVIYTIKCSQCETKATSLGMPAGMNERKFARVVRHNGWEIRVDGTTLRPAHRTRRSPKWLPRPVQTEFTFLDPVERAGEDEMEGRRMMDAQDQLSERGEVD